MREFSKKERTAWADRRTSALLLTIGDVLMPQASLRKELQPAPAQSGSLSPACQAGIRIF